MSLYAPAPPNEGIQIIGAGLSRLMSHRNSCAYAAMSGIPTDELTVALPHPVYFISVDDLVAGRLVEATVLSGWRYIVLHGDQPLLAATLTLAPNRRKFEFSHASVGPFVPGTIEGIRRAGKSKKLNQGGFDLRLLEVPSLDIVSLWFHAEGNELFMPLSPARKPLKSYKIYSENALVNALGESAAKRIQVKDARA